jgi:Bax protein
LVAELVVIYLAGQQIYLHYTKEDTRLVQARQLLVHDSGDIQTRKTAFFAFMRPIIEAENQRIETLRRRLTAARRIGGKPVWVAAVAKDYGIPWSGVEWVALLQRVDTAPLPLVLAQSANESNWGRSRFAQEGNNMFGQWCFRPGCGLVPRHRNTGAGHEVASYATVNASVRAYLRNLKPGAAYQELRRLRWQTRQQGKTPSAMLLASGLERYSQRGAAYVDDIRAMIKGNRELMLDAGAGS